VGKLKLVLVAGLGRGYIGGPVAIAFRLQRVFLGRPFVESADNGHRLGVGGPHPEGGAGGVRYGAHAGLQVGEGTAGANLDLEEVGGVDLARGAALGALALDIDGTAARRPGSQKCGRY
jgi:hypothetical protein